MPETEKARRPRATAEDKARAKRIERLAMRLWIAAEQIGQVWRDAEYVGDVTMLKAYESSLLREEQRVLNSSVSRAE